MSRPLLIHSVIFTLCISGLELGSTLKAAVDHCPTSLHRACSTDELGQWSPAAFSVEPNSKPLVHHPFISTAVFPYLHSIHFLITFINSQPVIRSQ